MIIVPRAMVDTDTQSVLCIVVTSSGQYINSCDPELLGIKSYQICMKIYIVNIECLLIR